MKPKPKSPAWTGPGYGQGGVTAEKYSAVSLRLLILRNASSDIQADG